jgi:hypothetical protein
LAQTSCYERADINEKLTKKSLKGFCGQESYFLGMAVLCNNTRIWS